MDHEVTLAVVYSLAKLYALCDRTSDTDAALDWLGKEHLKLWGTTDRRTAAHLLRVSELLQRWSRFDEMTTLLNPALTNP